MMRVVEDHGKAPEDLRPDNPGSSAHRQILRVEVD